MNKRFFAAVAISASLGAVALVRADAQAAKDYVKQAQELVDKKDTDGAKAKLELAQTELDGVDADTKTSITASIKTVQDSIASINKASDVDKYHRKLGMVMDEAEGSVGNIVTWSVVSAAAKEVFDDPAAQAAIPDEIAAAKKKFATFDKLNAQKTAVVVAARVADVMKELDAKWAEDKPKFTDPKSDPGDKSTALEEMNRQIESTKAEIAKLPADNADAKSDNAHVDKIGAELVQLAMADKAKDVLARQKEYLAGYKSEFDGWEAETGAGPSWADYQHQQNDTISAFNAPKTKAFISRSETFLKDLDKNDDYKAVAAAPDMKAFVDNVKSDHAKAYGQMLKHANPLVTSALATGGDGLSRLKDDVRLALGEDSPEGKAMQESIQKKIDGGVAAAAAGDEAQKAWYTKMTAAANAAWPGIAAKYTATEGFDPNDPASFKGKTIKITTSNLMGWRFMPGDFDFATTLRGMPIAGHFDPALKAAIADVEKKMGRSLGDSDDDGKWEVYAVVTGSKGRMMQRKQAEGDVKVDGQSVGKVTSNYEEPVDAPIINVIAGKCGPFAGGAGAQVVQTDGTLATAAAPASMSGGSSVIKWFFMLIVIAFAAIVAVVLRGKPVPEPFEQYRLQLDKALQPLLARFRAPK